MVTQTIESQIELCLKDQGKLPVEVSVGKPAQRETPELFTADELVRLFRQGDLVSIRGY